MQITVKPNTYIFVAVLLLLVPFPWLVAWSLAIVVHELCHWLAVRLCGGRIKRLCVGVAGADMQSSGLSERKYLFSVLCGPIGGFLPILFGAWIPRIALCSWLLSVYNLMPVLPLDGGRALQIFLNNETKFHKIEKIFLISVTICATYVAVFLHLGLLPVCIVGILWLKSRKIPCKEWICKVQ